MSRAKQLAWSPRGPGEHVSPLHPIHSACSEFCHATSLLHATRRICHKAHPRSRSAAIAPPIVCLAPRLPPQTTNTRQPIMKTISKTKNARFGLTAATPSPMPGRSDAAGALRVLALLVAFFVTAMSVHASHFRGASLTWKKLPPPASANTIEVTVTESWRTDFGPSLGQTYTWGDSSSFRTRRRPRDRQRLECHRPFHDQTNGRDAHLRRRRTVHDQSGRWQPHWGTTCQCLKRQLGPSGGCGSTQRQPRIASHFKPDPPSNDPRRSQHSAAQFCRRGRRWRHIPDGNKWRVGHRHSCGCRWSEPECIFLTES